MINTFLDKFKADNVSVTGGPSLLAAEPLPLIYICRRHRLRTGRGPHCGVRVSNADADGNNDSHGHGLQANNGKHLGDKRHPGAGEGRRRTGADSFETALGRPVPGNDLGVLEQSAIIGAQSEYRNVTVWRAAQASRFGTGSQLCLRGTARCGRQPDYTADQHLWN